MTSKTSFQQLVFSQRGVRESTMMRNLLVGFANGFFFLGKAIIASFGESINKIARAQHDEVVDGAQGGHLLHGLVGGAVFAQAHAVMGEHERHR